jgi:hypothetical protein
MGGLLVGSVSGPCSAAPAAPPDGAQGCVLLLRRGICGNTLSTGPRKFNLLGGVGAPSRGGGQVAGGGYLRAHP